MKKLRRLVRHAWRALSARVQALPGYEGVARWLGALTPVGWAVIAAMVAGTVAALAFGWLEGFIVAVMGLVALVVAVASVASPSPLSVSLRMKNDRIVAGQVAVGRVRVVNESGRRSGSTLVEVTIGRGSGEFLVPPISGNGTWNESFSVMTKRRGVINVGPARTVRMDGLGLLRRVRSWDDPILVHVHPPTVRFSFDATGMQMDVEGVASEKLTSSDVSFHALRDYEPGDDRRAVHWPSTARFGRLIVRQFEETHRSHHMVLLDTRVDAWDRRSFETAVSVAASLALAGSGEARTVSMHTADEWIPTGSPMAMLDALSEMETSTRSEFAGIVRRCIMERGGISVLSIVVGAGVDDEEAARLANIAPVDVIVSVIRVVPGRARRRRKITRGVIIDCPSLEDLPMLVSRGVNA
ncbi:DUF58 domain-containing protein [Schaalia odontolytica]|uniref:DUF58 domain-containing protein n=1 Tax=Schaalia odontolytica TaxID=1660 RepID=A0A0V8RZN8_9ACTO|nr:DUF58 domain-containing protein [Schaalia odontolytica]EWC98940.1 PF01882 family protein [Actinomyces sp. ICM54]KSW13545.1 hypothetical protein APY09_04175 [Schaalia odontolytica]QCT34831.1 DUF58 domain-containing protein [Schaalia odontolytica]